MSDSKTPQNVPKGTQGQVDVLDVKILFDAVHLAQRRGGFTLDEAGVIHKTVEKLKPILEKVFPNKKADSKQNDVIKKDEHSVSLMDEMK